jgi:hypothetical protein
MIGKVNMSTEFAAVAGFLDLCLTKYMMMMTMTTSTLHLLFKKDVVFLTGVTLKYKRFCTCNLCQLCGRHPKICKDLMTACGCFERAELDL